MAVVRMLQRLLRDDGLGRYVVPIVPDEARTFGMDGLFPQAGIFSLEGQQYQPVDAGTIAPYREAEDGPDPPGRHLRDRRHGLVPRRRHGVRQPRPADDPVLHLLFDVRLPARRRHDLGVRGHDVQGLPARRHLRPHDPERRGRAAPGRPLPRDGVHGAEPRELRPGVRVRNRGHRPGRHPAHVRRVRGRLLLRDRDQPELRHAAHPGGCRGRDHRGDVLLPAGGGGAGQPARQRRDHDGNPGGGGHSGRTGRAGQRLERDQLQRVGAPGDAGGTRADAERGRRGRRGLTWRNCWPTRKACSWPLRTT